MKKRLFTTTDVHITPDNMCEYLNVRNIRKVGYRGNRFDDFIWWVYFYSSFFHTSSV